MYTIPVLKAGHPGVPSYMYVCLFVRDMVGWVILLSFLSYFFKLVCYAHVFPCMYICVHTLYMIVLTLQNSCTLRYIYVVWRDLVSVSIYGAWVREPSFTWGVMWHVGRRTAVAARVLSLRCGYAIHTSL